jgi:phosphate:Na+ symporter
MLQKLLLPIIFVLLGYGFWSSAEFKTVAAGVAIFLFGMLSLEEGFKTFTGGTLEKLLKASTNRIWKSLAFGIVTTSVMQSSSLVSVITISFLSAGLLELTSAIGIIFGANLGTTTGAWLVAGFGLKVNLSSYAMPMLVFGIILVFQRAKNLKGVGYVLAGLGFLFLGIHFMKEGFDSVSQTIDLAEYSMTGYAGVLAFAGLGILATVVMQSSHATLVLILAALAAQQVSYENALALAIGSNVGTTITAIIGAMSSGIEGKRLAAAHLIFNLVTGLIAIIAIQQLIVAVSWISVHLGIRPDNYTLQLAVFHSLFNLIGILVMLPLISQLVRFLKKLMPEKQADVEKPIYLSDASMEVADAAVQAVRKESIRLYDLAVDVIIDGLNIRRDVFVSGEKSKRVIKKSTKVIDEDFDDLYERKLKALYGAIVEFTIRIKGGYTGGRLREELSRYRKAGQDVIEAVKGVKHLRKNLNFFMRSDNQYTKADYNKLRRLVVRTLREIEVIRQTDDHTDSILSLDRFKLEIEKGIEKISNGLDELIRKNRIDVQMATSLMNDITYCREICWNLLEASAALFSESDLDEKAALRSVALDEHEIINILEHPEQEKSS